MSEVCRRALLRVAMGAVLLTACKDECRAELNAAQAVVDEVDVRSARSLQRAARAMELAAQRCRESGKRLESAQAERARRRVQGYADRLEPPAAR